MEKIIVRKKLLDVGVLSMASDSVSFQNRNTEFILKNIFSEADASYSELKSSYNDMITCQCRANKYFEYCYRINDEFGLFLDANIYLYHLPKDNKLYSNIIPWYYADAKKYLGDTWWESDEEILNNIEKFSVIDFLKRYKGYY